MGWKTLKTPALGCVLQLLILIWGGVYLRCQIYTPLSSCTTLKHSFHYILIATLEATILRVDPRRAKTGSFGDHILETPLTKWEGMNHGVERFALWVSALCSSWLRHWNAQSSQKLIGTKHLCEPECSENDSVMRSTNLQLWGKVLKHWMFVFLLKTSKPKGSICAQI